MNSLATTLSSAQAEDVNVVSADELRGVNGKGDIVQRPEQAIQKAVFEHIKRRAAPGVFAFHPFSGGYRRPREAAIMKGCGAIAGLPDVIAIRAGKVFALELKAEGRKATPAQIETMAAMEAAGAYTCIADGLDRALATLETWGILRRSA